VVKSSHEINNGSLNKMGFIKVNNIRVSKDEDFVGPFARSSRNAGLDDEAGPSVVAVEDYSMDAPVSYEPPVDHGIPMSQFERLMINHMDTMASMGETLVRLYHLVVVFELLFSIILLC